MIYIIGPRRSGTSLMRAILSTHPDIDIPPNDYNLLNTYQILFDSDKEKRQILYEEMIKDRELKDWNLDHDKLRECLIENYKEPLVSVRNILDNYFRNNNKVRAIKRPAWEYYIGLLEDLYPRSKYIYMARNPNGIIASQKFYKRKEQWSDIETTIKKAKKVENSLKAILTYKKILDMEIFILKYESLILNTDESIKRIYDFINVKPNKFKPNYDDIYIMGMDSSFSCKNAKSIYKSSLNKWKNVLSNEEIKEVNNNTQLYRKICRY